MKLNIVKSFSNDALIRKIVVHDGLFHLDEMAAITLLILAKDISVDPSQNWEVIRSRNPEIIGSANYVLDVGGVFDGSNMFDHHYKDCPKHSNGIPYASAGMVFETFKGNLAEIYSAGHSSEFMEEFDSFVLAIDAMDNGKLPFNTNELQLPQLGEIVRMHNSFKDKEQAFKDAFSLVWNIFQAKILDFQERMRDSDVIRNALKTSNEILVLPKFCRGWKEICLEEAPNVKVALVPAEPGTWSITSALKEKNSLECKAPCHEYFRTKEVETIGGCKKVFVHPVGFTGKVMASTQEDAVKAAYAWINGPEA